jgi:ABC-2 type transport system permease protein
MFAVGNLGTIFRKELRGYFVTPIAYIVITIFLVLTGWFFFSTFFLYAQAELRSFFTLLPVILSFIIPAVTMRLFSEEFNIGSYEMLVTLPVSLNDVIIGKFLAGAAFTAIMMVPTLAYAVTAARLGDLDWGPVVGGYLGSLLLGGSFTAIGLLASSLTRNQIIAFIIGMIICFALAMVDKFLFFLPGRMLGFFQYIGADYHFQNIAKGVIDSRDVIYFLSVMFIALYLTHLRMKERQ